MVPSIPILDLRAATGGLAAARAAAAERAVAGVRVVTVLRAALALLIVANLGRIPLVSAGDKDAPVLFNDLFVLTVLVAGTAAALQRRRLVLDGPAAVALAFAAAGAFSAIIAVPRFGLSPFEYLFSVAYLLRWLAYFGLYLVAINFVGRADVPDVYRTLERMILAFAAFGIVQSIFLPGFAQMVYPDSEAYVDWDIQGHRLVSTFLDPNFAGGAIVMVLLVMIARLAFGGAVTWWKPMLLFAALVLTISRSSVLGWLVGMMVIGAVRGLSRRMWKFGAALLVVLIPTIPLILEYALRFNKLTIDASALARVASWITGIEIFLDNPLLGVGFNTYGFVRLRYGYEAGGMASFAVDGGLLFIAVMTGLVGVVLYSLMLALVVRRCRRIWRDAARTPEDRGLALGVAAATAALLVHSIFLNSLLYPFIMELLWVLWALTFALRTPAEPTEAAREESRPAAGAPRGAGTPVLVGWPAHG